MPVCPRGWSAIVSAVQTALSLVVGKGVFVPGFFHAGGGTAVLALLIPTAGESPFPAWEIVVPRASPPEPMADTKSSPAVWVVIGAGAGAAEEPLVPTGETSRGAAV